MSSEFDLELSAAMVEVQRITRKYVVFDDPEGSEERACSINEALFAEIEDVLRGQLAVMMAKQFRLEDER